ncbi:indolepyruvate ferredoxin oxidoreductase family protein [Sphingosinicella terrae]|uniref:indolepyruvate ferredoxin oxidoreductase family protein n=1 Tax=Sphingosinicella terrae TaxID=2172047 RepID=UPI002546DC98|nr:indolepyruvate ferredoxin oxidoreductase family protein [Sphingosinicella terrae]
MRDMALDRATNAPAPFGAATKLDDKWCRRSGRVLISGSQAIVRVLLSQAARDRESGRNTAGFVSGYRGSPLGGLDRMFWQARDSLSSARVHFQPGVNEELAATAVHGTQQVPLMPGARHEGVFAAWYAKGPGVDRALDALKHGNISGGTSRLGGVLCFYGDDHPGKSSTVAHQSEQAMASSLIPSLYPADASEILRFGLLGFALSRYSGAWVGIKCVNETAEQTQTVDLECERLEIVEPDLPLPPEGVHGRLGPYNPQRDEQIALEERLPRVRAFVRANGIDRTVFRAERPRLGIVAAGKSFGDVREALRRLNLDDAEAARIGISLYKVGCIWPLEPEGLAEFAAGHQALLVIEEKKSFLEEQAAAILFNAPDRPLLLGKRDEEGSRLLSSTTLLEAGDIAGAIAGRLARLGIGAALGFGDQDIENDPPGDGSDATPRRAPFFCSGCPHSRSTRIPPGSLSMTGIGCHAMAALVRPKEALPSGQMGGEGANWIGIAPFTDAPHIFQNMGDGTYYHSGLLAIRAAVAAGIGITYKILYNDAVAMTGGQPVDGPISVAEIVRQVAAEGVREVVVVSEDPGRHRGTGLPSGVRLHHRDELEAVQLRLRDVQGTTVLIYEQTCAAEKRRRRKRGQVPDPPKRMFIAKAVCEGCGDCSVQSTCVSIQPVPTAFGTKRRIDQESCNKDYSCANGFCPSFITVRGGRKRSSGISELDPSLVERLPRPAVRDGANLMIAGIGGTGVITASALIGMAAHLEGKSASLFDMTGLAQKNGSVCSHVRVAKTAGEIPAQRIGKGQADVLIAFDLVAALGSDVAPTLARGRTRAVVNTEVVPTVAFQFVRDFDLGRARLIERLGALVDGSAMMRIDAARLTTSLLGQGVTATSFLLGAASQAGLLPVSASAIEEAIRLNGMAVRENLTAFQLGRLHAHDERALAALAPGRGAGSHEPVPETLAQIVEHRNAHLVRYQGETLAARYRLLVGRAQSREAEVVPGSEELARVVARNYARLLAYKDEYEVVRLLTDPSLRAEIEEEFGKGAKLALNMAPPILTAKGANGRPRKGQFPEAIRPVLKLLARGRRLRGTWADPFGHTEERRLERALIAEYEQLVERVLATLSTGNHRQAVTILGLADEIRGYGPVKAEAVVQYRRRLHALTEETLSPQA